MASEYQQFINGEFVPSKSNSTIEVENPTNHEILSIVPEGCAEDAEAAINAAYAAKNDWAALPVPTRAGYLKKFAKVIRENTEMLAETLAKEQSKVIGLARVEIEVTAEYYEYYAGWARIYGGETINSDNAKETIYLTRKPVGLAVGICPWNFPCFVMARKIAPALLAGCTSVVKTSEFTPNTCFEMAKLFATVDLPKGVVNIVTGKGEIVGAALAASPKVDIISLTGSVRAGKSVYAAAAQNMTKVNLELGGKAPVIVCAECDLDMTVQAVVTSRVLFTGQICNSAERVYVEEGIYDEFLSKITDAMSKVTGGDPFADPAPDMGSLLSQAQLDKVSGMVERAVAAGAKVECGGQKDSTKDKGYYYLPTVLTNVQQDSEIMQDEIFGPVLPVMKVKDLAEAIDKANDSYYGLTSSIFTNNTNNVQRAMAELRFGETYVNRNHFEAMQGFHAGWRHSGVGGADGKWGLHEYLQSHVTYVQGQY